MSNFHGRIMNIRAKDTLNPAYLAGHRDARHSAAEIANEADALAARLAEADDDNRAMRVAGGECERDLRLANERLAEVERDAARYRWLVQERYEFGPTRCADDLCMSAPIGLWVAYNGPDTARAVGEAIDSDRAASTVTVKHE